MPPTALDISPHAVARDPLPLETRDELSRSLVQVLHQEREGLARRLFRREDLDDAITDQQMVPVAVDGGIGDEVVQMRVMRQARGIHHGGFVVHQLTKESKRLVLAQTRWTEVADLDLE